jgi:hypothetical protein
LEEKPAKVEPTEKEKAPEAEAMDSTPSESVAEVSAPAAEEVAILPSKLKFVNTVPGNL